MPPDYESMIHHHIPSYPLWRLSLIARSLAINGIFVNAVESCERADFCISAKDLSRLGLYQDRQYVAEDIIVTVLRKVSPTILAADFNPDPPIIYEKGVPDGASSSIELPYSLLQKEIAALVGNGRFPWFYFSRNQWRRQSD